MAKHARVGGSDDDVVGLPSPDQSRMAAPTAAKHAAGGRKAMRRSIVGVVVVALVVGLTVGGLVVISGLNPGSQGQAAAQAPATSPSPSGATARTAPAEPPSHASSAAAISLTSAAATLPAPVLASLPSTGPGLTEPGVLLMAWPASDGSFDVVEWVRLARPVSELTLRPAPIDQAGSQFAPSSATATQVQASAGDLPITIPGAEVDARMDLPVAPTDHFELRYRLTDVSVRSAPSTTGRALAAIGSLTGGLEDELPTQFIVTGESVLGLYCPLLPFPEQACGRHLPTGPGAERELPSRLALTTVQFDLPPT